MAETADYRAIAREIRHLPEFQPLSLKQRMFLIAYIACGNFYQAAEHLGVSWMCHYQWKWKNPLYVKAMAIAEEMYADYAEGDVYQRAFHGEIHTISKKGQILETFRQKSDILAMFALKKLRPAFRDNPQLAVQVNQAPPAIQINLSSGDKALENKGNVPELPNFLNLPNPANSHNSEDNSK